MAGTPFESFMVKDGVDDTMVEGMKAVRPAHAAVGSPPAGECGVVVAQRAPPG
jgi:hypothetical protein